MRYLILLLVAVGLCVTGYVAYDPVVDASILRALKHHNAPVDLGPGLHARHFAEVIDYHADTLELARMAEGAGVKALVLTHLIPSPPNWLAEQLFKRGMSKHFHGQVTVGRDGLRISLPPKS